MIAGRNGNRVVLVGGKDTAEAVDRGSREPALTSPQAVFGPGKPYPKYLDAYDLEALSCYTLGLHPENRYRYADRAAFVKQFFTGGYAGQMAFFQETPAEGVSRTRSVLDTDLRLAEQENQMYGLAISTGSWPLWAENKWPSCLDHGSSLHFENQFAQYPPEALGLSLDQRMSEMHFTVNDLVLGCAAQ
jgi:hypothetical protein